MEVDQDFCFIFSFLVAQPVAFFSLYVHFGFSEIQCDCLFILRRS